jgi:hypothetical protein
MPSVASPSLMAFPLQSTAAASATATPAARAMGATLCIQQSYILITTSTSDLL